MNFFDDASLRLKQQLSCNEDQQVATALGLTKASWAMRKKRGTFPEKELRALAQKQPGLRLDVDYVMTGIPGATPGAGAAATPAQTMRAAMPPPSVMEELQRQQWARGFGAGAHWHVADSGPEAPYFQPPVLTADEQRLIEMFRACGIEAQAALLLVAKGLMAVVARS